MMTIILTRHYSETDSPTTCYRQLDQVLFIRAKLLNRSAWEIFAVIPDDISRVHVMQKSCVAGGVRCQINTMSTFPKYSRETSVAKSQRGSLTAGRTVRVRVSSSIFEIHKHLQVPREVISRQECQ